MYRIQRLVSAPSTATATATATATLTAVTMQQQRRWIHSPVLLAASNWSKRAFATAPPPVPASTVPAPAPTSPPAFNTSPTADGGSGSRSRRRTLRAALTGSGGSGSGSGSGIVNPFSVMVQRFAVRHARVRAFFERSRKAVIERAERTEKRWKQKRVDAQVQKVLLRSQRFGLVPLQDAVNRIFNPSLVRRLESFRLRDRLVLRWKRTAARVLPLGSNSIGNHVTVFADGMCLCLERLERTSVSMNAAV